MFVDSSVMDYFRSEMVLVKVNGTVDSALAREHKVQAYPTLVMLDTKGEEIDRIVGYLEPEEFLQTVRDYLVGIGTLDDLLKRHEEEPDREVAYEIAGKYRHRGASEEAKAWYQEVLDGSEELDSLNYSSRKSLAAMARIGGHLDTAESIFSEMMQNFAASDYAEDAEIWHAYIIEQRNDTARAVAAYEAFLEHHPQSDDTTFARKRLGNLKGETSE